jgi:hypothetical protein
MAGALEACSHVARFEASLVGQKENMGGKR